jgi:hypothetical protein
MSHAESRSFSEVGAAMNYITVVVVCVAAMAVMLLVYVQQDERQHPSAPGRPGISQVACAHPAKTPGLPFVGTCK